MTTTALASSIAVQLFFGPKEVFALIVVLLRLAVRRRTSLQCCHAPSLNGAGCTHFSTAQ
jgi:hypothetical protein